MRGSDIFALYDATQRVTRWAPWPLSKLYLRRWLDLILQHVPASTRPVSLCPGVEVRQRGGLPAIAVYSRSRWCLLPPIPWDCEQYLRRHAWEIAVSAVDHAISRR